MKYDRYLWISITDLKNFIDGLIIFTAPIIAVIGILINKKKASKRDVANQTRNFKLNMLEKTYEKYNEFSRKICCLDPIEINIKEKWFMN